ncbi:MAG: DUF2283 domain-containing protein [bacterium]
MGEQRALRISYDPEVDALYIRLLEGDPQCRRVRLRDEIGMNLAKDETLAGVEVLDAKRILGKGEIPRSSWNTYPPAVSAQ